MIDEKLLLELRNYVNGHMEVLAFPTSRMSRCEERSIHEDIGYSGLEDFIKNRRKPTFSQVLFDFIDKKGCTDLDIYKKAGIDRRHFSKIKSNTEYRIGKNTAVALALALQLNKKETDKLLSAAGYSLSDCDTFDLVIQFCIEKKVYDLQSVNEALDYFGLRPLGGVVE